MAERQGSESERKRGLLKGEAREEAQAGLANRGLKIAKVEPFCLHWPDFGLLWTFVRLETEEGLVGFGEATGTTLAPIVSALQVFGEAFLVGESAWNIDGLWAKYRDQYTHGSVTQAALSAIDIACWDLIGKKLNLPLYALLGGKVNERVGIYHHPWGHGVESYEEATRRLVSEGLMAGKLDPFRSQGYSRDLTSQELDDAVRVIQGIREGGGPDFVICVEMHGRFNVATAIRVADAMKPFKPLFIEEPVPAENVPAMREVQRATTLAVATGEKLRNTGEFLPLLEQRACRILQPDIGHMGGVTGLKRLAHLADDYYLTVAPHCCWGPVHTMAAAQVCLTIPNLLLQETINLQEGIYEETVVGGYRYDPEYLDVPEAPGIGIHLSEEFIKEYRVDPVKWDGEWLRRRAAARGGR